MRVLYMLRNNFSNGPNLIMYCDRVDNSIDKGKWSPTARMGNHVFKYIGLLILLGYCLDLRRPFGCFACTHVPFPRQLMSMISTLRCRRWLYTTECGYHGSIS